MLTFSNNSLYSSILSIQRRSRDRVTPPDRSLYIVQRKRNEDEQRAKRQSEIQSTAGQVVQPRPPGEVPLSDELLENKADYTPRQVIKRCSWWYLTRATEDQWCHEVLEWRAWELPGAEVEDHWDYCTDTEEPEEAGVDLTW